MYAVVSQKPSSDTWERDAQRCNWMKVFAFWPVRITMESKWRFDVIVWGEFVEVASGDNGLGIVQNWYRSPLSKARIERLARLLSKSPQSETDREN